MGITERERIRLRQEVSKVTNDETADVLMRSLPPTGWGDVATKADLESLRLATKADIELVRAEIKHELEMQTQFLRLEFYNQLAEFKVDVATEFGKIRSEMATEFGEIRSEMATEFGEIRSEMATEFGKVRSEMAEMQAGFERAIHAQTKSMFTMIFAMNSLFAGVLLAASRLF